MALLAAAALVALILIGQTLYVIHLRSTLRSPAEVGPNATLEQRLDSVLAAALGPSDRHVRRFRVSVSADRHRGGRSNITVTWAINRDISAGTVGNGAENDVYSMLASIYGSDLPVSGTSMIGTYPLTPNRRDSIVMRLFMSRQNGELADQIGWDTLSAQDVWGLVSRRYVQSSLQPQVGD